MSRTLVVYYSMTGHTVKVAEAIAARLSADIERVEDARPRGVFRALWETILRISPPIRPTRFNPADYDRVILGTPIWAARMASPMRTYIGRARKDFRRIALFCSEGGMNGEKALRRMAEYCRRAPDATLVVTERQLDADTLGPLVDDFITSLTAVPAA